jgi:hypothetical protein
MKASVRRLLLAVSIVLILIDLGTWIYFYANPPAPSWFGIVVGLVAALAVACAALGGLSEFATPPFPDPPPDDQDLG